MAQIICNTTIQHKKAYASETMCHMFSLAHICSWSHITSDC